MVEKGLRDSRDLGRFVVATITDVLSGTLHVRIGQFNISAAREIIQIAKLEYSMSLPRKGEMKPFDLPQ